VVAGIAVAASVFGTLWTVVAAKSVARGQAIVQIDDDLYAMLEGHETFRAGIKWPKDGCPMDPDLA